MLLASILFIPAAAAGLVLMFKSRRAATAFAVGAGILEVLGLALAVWRVSRTGSLEFGKYLRADSLTAFFLVNLGAVFFLVLLYSTSYIRHIPAGRFSSPRWFYSLLVGYGTKIGLVPMHSWLPDAHAEAPSPVSAMLSAALLNCAVYALVRYDAITSNAIGPTFSHRLFIFFGAASVLVAGLLMILQKDLKRLLAYSSVEHMGIIATGLGLGGFFGVYGALLHTFTHSMAKSLLFFGAGHVRAKAGTSKIAMLKGLARQLPWTSAALVVGLIAIVGLPPFGL